MRFDLVKRRLAKLEVGASSADAVLLFADGATRAVNIYHPLELFCATCARLAYLCRTNREALAIVGEGEGEAVEPVSPYDELVNMFARAVELRSEDKFLHTIFGLCRQIAEEAPKKTQ